VIEIRRIDNFDSPELAPLPDLEAAEEHRKQGIFVVEGHRVMERLLETDLQILSCLFPDKWENHFKAGARGAARTDYCLPGAFAGDGKMDGLHLLPRRVGGGASPAKART